MVWSYEGETGVIIEDRKVNEINWISWVKKGRILKLIGKKVGREKK